MKSGDTTSFSLNYDAEIATVPVCDGPALSFHQIVVSESTNPEVVVNEIMLPSIFQFDQFKKIFSVELPSEVADAN